MGNNRSTLASGSTATTASLNSTSSLPVNSSTANQPISLQTHANGTQSSVSFLKRFRNPNPSSHNLDDLDHTDSNDRKKNFKNNGFKKKKQIDDGASKKNNKNRKKIEKNKAISLSTSDLAKSSKSSTNETEYTSINEYSAENSKPVLEEKTENSGSINSHSKEESFYESTLDMDLANGTNKDNIDNNSQKTTMPQSHSPTFNKQANKENTENSTSNLDSNANLYSEIINKNLPSKNGQAISVTSAAQNKKNHLQPLTNLFNKLTKTTGKEKDVSHEANQIRISPPTTPPPMVPSKAFNPTKEFYNDLEATIKTFEEELDEEDEDYGDIYSKIDKTEDLTTNNIPPLPKTLVPTNLLNEEVETCLNLKSSSLNGNEYQSMQEYEDIKADNSSRDIEKPILYTTIEPLDVNNQVYYSFTSVSQEKFDTPDKFISQVDVKCNNNNKLFFKIDPSIGPKSKKSKANNLYLIDEIEKSRNQSDLANQYTVKL